MSAIAGARKRALVTGASSGIGASSARALAAAGFHVILGARRLERLEQLAKEIDGQAAELDVTKPASVDALIRALNEEPLNLLVNNAGGARGLAHLDNMDEDHWRWMWETNVLGLARMTKAALPLLRKSGDGHIINIGSIAGLESYEAGSGYTTSKHAVRVITQTLRKELLGEPIRITEIDPGLVETEFSIVRFDGDFDRAKKVYEGIDALTADDIADLVAFAATRPSHVNIDQIVVKPLAQASATSVHRTSE